jgi:SAM-dependent methyltransferase
MDVCERNRIGEWMDEPDLEAGLHEQALSAIRRINLFSRTATFLARRIACEARARNLTRLRILDVASGGGDNALGIARALRANGFRPQIDGWDISATAVRLSNAAADRLHESSVQFFQRDALQDDIQRPYDFIVSSLFFHHLERDDTVHLLRRLAAKTGVALLINDLLRSRVGYWLAWAGCRLITRSPVVRFDGPTSVQSAYSLAEIREIAKESGLSDAQLSRHWPERFLLAWSP